MGGKTQTTTQQATNAPWAPQQPYIMQGLQQAQANLGKSTVAPLSAQTKAGLGMIEQTAQNSQIPQQAAQQLSSTLGGAYLNGPQSWQNTLQPQATGPGQPPRQSEIISAGSMLPGFRGGSGLGALENAFSHDITPAVQGQYATAGRSGFSPGAKGNIQEGVADAMAPYMFQSAENQMNRLFGGYQNERDRMMGATAQAPGIDQLQYSPGQNMLGAGSVYDQYNQQVANEPWNNLGNYMHIVGQPFGQQSSSVSTAPKQGLFSGNGSAASLGMRAMGK